MVEGRSAVGGERGVMLQVIVVIFTLAVVMLMVVVARLEWFDCHLVILQVAWEVMCMWWWDRVVVAMLLEVICGCLVAQQRHLAVWVVVCMCLAEMVVVMIVGLDWEVW